MRVRFVTVAKPVPTGTAWIQLANDSYVPVTQLVLNAFALMKSTGLTGRGTNAAT